MKRICIFALIACFPFTAGAGVPGFFSDLIGSNVKNYCQKSDQEKEEVMASVNSHTGNHKVVVVCSETVAEAEPIKAGPRSRRTTH